LRGQRDPQPRSGTGQRAFAWLAAGLLVVAVLLFAPGLVRRFGTADSQSGSPASPTGAPVGQSANHQAKVSDGRVVELVNRGTQALEKGDPAAAVSFFREALQINPKDEDLHYNLGIAYARQNMTEKAIEHYNEALRLFPDYVEAHNNLGNLLMRLRRLDEAVEHFRAAIKIMPDYASGYNNLGTALQQLGKLDEALLQFEKAVQANPDYWEARYNLGQSYLRQGRLPEARIQLEKVLQAQPGFEPAIQALQRADPLLPNPEQPQP